VTGLRSKLFFAVITIFWVAMNALLWRWQSGAHSKIGNAVPPEVVWNKILTAPDNSSLDIYDHDKKIGFCHWVATAGSATQVLNETLVDDYAPEEAIPQPTGYGLTLDGNTSIFGTNRARFDVHMRLSTNQVWQDFHVTAKMRPYAWDIHAVESAQKIMIKANDDGVIWQKTLSFSDFQHPETLLSELGMPDTLGLTGMAGLTGLAFQENSVKQAAATLKWDAHEDWMKFGHSRVRVYRLETQFLGQHLYVFTSQVGEILWVEAPNKLTFRNEAFNHF
jgi:hypothetical protein